MKVYITILSLLLLTSCSQETTFAGKLSRQGLIYPEDVEVVDSIILSGKDTRERNALFAIYYNAINRGYFYPSNEARSFADEIMRSGVSYNDKTRMTLIDYISKLHKMKLVTDAVRDTMKTLIKQGDVDTEEEVVKKSYNLTHYTDWVKPSSLKNYADSLAAAGLIPRDSLAKLTTDLAAGRVTTEWALLRYLPNTVNFLPGPSWGEPAAYIPEAHRMLAEAVPGLKYSQLIYFIETDSTASTDSYVNYNFLVSAYSAGKLYKHRSRYRGRETASNEYSEELIDFDSFYQLFNKMLVDQKSPYRIHRLFSSGNFEGPREQKRSYYIALREEQLRAFSSGPHYFDLSDEPYGDAMTSQDLSAAFSTLRQAGILRHLSNAEIARQMDLAACANYLPRNMLISFLPEVTLAFSYDDEVDLESVIGRLQFASHTYNGSTVIDTLGNGLFNARFSLDGGEYSVNYLDPNSMSVYQIVERVNFALVNARKAARFYPIVNVSGDEEWIYLTPAQVTALVKSRLCEFPSPPHP